MKDTADRTSKSQSFPARVVNLELGTNVHSSETAIVESDDRGGATVASVYAAHNWMDANVGPQRHTEDVCEQFNDCQGDIAHLEVGFCLFIVDGPGAMRCFVGSKLPRSRLLPHLPEEAR